MKPPKLNFKSFLFELIIVFVGVYGAFELNRYQEHQREERIKINYFNSFQSELVKLTSDIRYSQRQINQKLAVLDSGFSSGSRPALTPLKLSFEARMLITKAGFNDDVFTQMSASLSASLSGGYDNVQEVSKLADEFNRACILHLLAKNQNEFYDTKGQLKPEYGWYYQDLLHLKYRFDRLEKMISEGALPATKEVLKELE